jgi:hypothetical protein
MTQFGALDVLRPFAWLALVAFLVGVVSYLALGQPSQAFAQERAHAALVSGPASDDWNLPKHI